jgi:hypothetical protein
MKKLSLVVEDLQVESFDIVQAEQGRGTVVGQQITGTMACNTRDVYWCSQQPTLNALDYLCYYSQGGGYCTAVCPTGYDVCDTSPEVCG